MGVVLTSVVSERALPNAITIVSITQYVGEIAAPFIFWMLADSVGVDGDLTAPFGVAALAFLPCAVLPRIMRADTMPAASSSTNSSSSNTTGSTSSSNTTTTTTTSGGSSGGGSNQGSGSGGEAQQASSVSAVSAVSRAWLNGLRRMVEGVKYIAGHPLLPGLYALDWGFT